MCFLCLLWLSSSRSPAIDRHRHHNDRPDNDLLNVVGPTDLLAAVAQERHDQRANHRPENASLTATQTPTANDYRGDDIQLRSRRDCRIALSQTRHLHHAGEPKQQTRQPIDPNLEPVSRDATRARRGFVRSERKHTSPKHRITQNDRRTNSENNCYPYARRNEQPRRFWKHYQQLIQPRARHVDRLLICQPLRNTTRYAKHSERRNERH